ncbi:hypothetical protein KNN17_06930 [Arthrobacter bambusae]|uniref:hypothetical protein n=1 Tax=Arthrobacter TaxID=1663 RepID=UPI001F511355|nr:MULTISPECIES: hypothetical protein [Arthrobacter]MCI0141310.1 hypothetical protein [Arthrobacter bambusae]UYY82163.1 hypothetical protein OIT41_03635 [Arthrobacter sp. YA7-1]
MSGQLTPEQSARLIELVGEAIQQEDAAAVERSFNDFQRGMAALRADFDPGRLQEAPEGGAND